MRVYDLYEKSDLTFQGSNTPDLIKSKEWLCEILAGLDLDISEFSTIYILGSWYGNMATVLKKMDIPFKKIINVDLDKDVLEKSEQLLKDAGIENIESMNKDVNMLDYRQVTADSLIINTSTQDINGNTWFNRIPKGVLVALQGRDSVKKPFKDLKDFDDSFPISKTLFLGKKKLEDPDTDYLRFMKIGIK
jgi:hypothetical protein